MYTEFEFTEYRTDWDKGEIIFRYTAFSENKKERIDFQEKLTLPLKKYEINTNDSTLDELLKSLHIALGISYYKLFCSKFIRTPFYDLSQDQANFWNTFYEKGLGELFYKNNIDYRKLVSFPFSKTFVPYNSEHSFEFSGCLVGFGGGKDSLLALEMLKKIDEKITLLYSHILHETAIKIENLPALKINRELDPKMYDLTFIKNFYNGHLPITGIYSFISILFCMLYGIKFSIFANERSSDNGNVDYLGSEINHQWSKSFEFENMFRSYIQKYITPDIEYFSLLRPLYEIEIVRHFTAYKEYFNTFTSCNRNFKQKNTTHIGWCGDCPKCAFIFALLGAFLPINNVSQIFKKNLFNDEKLVELYRELLGLREIKPFECVGQPDEVRLALYYIYTRHDSIESPVISMFEKEILPTFDKESTEKKVFSYGDDKNIPDRFKSLLKK